MNKRPIIFASALLIVVMISTVGARLWWIGEFDAASALLKTEQGGHEAALKLERLARLGSERAAHTLGLAYAFGWGGLPVEQQRAATWLVLANKNCKATVTNHDRCGGVEEAIAESYRSRQESGVTVNLDQAGYWSARARDRKSAR